MAAKQSRKSPKATALPKRVKRTDIKPTPLPKKGVMRPGVTRDELSLIVSAIDIATRDGANYSGPLTKSVTRANAKLMGLAKRLRRQLKPLSPTQIA